MNRRLIRFFAPLLTALCLLPLLPAFAASGLASCRYKVTTQVTLYVSAGESEISLDGAETLNGLVARATLPAGTYLRYLDGDSVTASRSDLARVSAYLSGDTPVSGYIPKDAIVSAVTKYTLSDGTVIDIPEALMSDRRALDNYLTSEYGGASVIWTQAMADAAARLGVTTGTTYTDETGKARDATLLRLGLGRSLIRVDGEELLVPTCRVSWDAEAPAGKELAVINAHKQGYASLRGKASSKGTVLVKCVTNRVVRVIKPGKKYTLIDYDGVRGYVKTSTLTFYANEEREWTPGLVSFRGKTAGSRNKVHVRSSNSSKARQIGDEYPVGTALTVFSNEGGWCEVDIDGWHCWILSEFVTKE